MFDVTKIFLVQFAVFTALLFAQPGLAGAQDLTIAKQAILVDLSTGQVLMEKNADEAMPTSSMSKVMTMYMVFDALKGGRITMDSELPVSAKAWQMGGSKMFVEVGKTAKVSDLIQGVIVQSGNDATVVLAEGIAGSEEEFAKQMTAKAHELGMSNSNFANASGWPDPNHYSTARDLALLAVHTLRDFPEDYHYYSEKEFTYNGIKQPNRNPLLLKNMGVDGIKTGHTEVGGYGMIASGERDGRRLVLVVNGLADDKERAQEAGRLMEWGFVAFENVSLFKAGDVVEQAEVWLGKEKTVPLTVEQDVQVTVPRAGKDGMKIAVRYQEPMPAPVHKGDKIAKLVIELPGAPARSIDLVAAEGAEKLGFFSRGVAKANYLLMGSR